MRHLPEKLDRQLGYSLKDIQGVPTVAIASDTRPSGESLKQSLILGLRDMAIQVLDFGIVPTPLCGFWNS